MSDWDERVDNLTPAGRKLKEIYRTIASSCPASSPYNCPTVFDKPKNNSEIKGLEKQKISDKSSIDAFFICLGSLTIFFSLGWWLISDYLSGRLRLFRRSKKNILFSRTSVKKKFV